MTKIFRAWDGEKYWYSDNQFRFHCLLKALCLHDASFELADLESFTGKTTSDGVKIFENDIIRNSIEDEGLFQVIWSPDDCGFKKVKLGKTIPLTAISGAFFDVVGTIHDY